MTKEQEEQARQGALLEAETIIEASDRVEYSIEIDCEPINARPDMYIKGVLQSTGLTLDDFLEPSKLFGNWKWELKDEARDKERFIAAKPILRERITKLYNSGAIRYGSW